MSESQRLIIVSNRLPVTVSGSGRDVEVTPSSGGLVTALTPLVRKTGGYWIGWPGADETPDLGWQIRQASAAWNCELVPVFLTAQQRGEFYCGFSNGILWPLFHDLQSRCTFEPAYWNAYREVNQRYTDAVLDIAGFGDFIWVHDYHLMLMAECLRQRGMRSTLAYFHHIPFPPPDIFEKLPWRTAILDALLKFTLVGFQTLRDQRNFLQCLKRFTPRVKIARRAGQTVVECRGDSVTVGAFPIGIDFDEFAEGAQEETVSKRAEALRRAVGTTMLLGIDRLDYTKGIPERLKAFRLLMETHPEMRGEISLVQVVVPSREDVPKYNDLRLEIERAVSEINGRFGGPDWVPVHFMHRQIPRSELLAYYRAADIALITPLKDGMNLVAKEFCAARVDNDGVLILSEFAGAATQLQAGALLVNPYDSKGIVEAILRAREMNADARGTRMRRMREVVRTDDVFRWCECFRRGAQAEKRKHVEKVYGRTQGNAFVSPIAVWRQSAGSL